MTQARLLGGRYQVGELLGYGGMAEVHRGRDLRLGRDVAIKMLRTDLARDDTFQLRFRREAQNAAALNHPAIVAVYDTGEERGSSGEALPYIVMEFVNGRTLKEVLQAEGRLMPRRALEITAEICAALEFSHRHQIIHRDIKPGNVMLTQTGQIKVMDFGIARALANPGNTMTQTSAVIGTAQYLSPEQARGEAVDARSDVYATGCVLYELVTGQPPFVGDSPVSVAYQHVREDPRPPSILNRDVPPPVDAVVLKALAKNPLNRYQSAAEMRADVLRAAQGRPVYAEPVMVNEHGATRVRPMSGGARPPAGRVPASAHRDGPNWTMWGLIGLAAVAVVALVIGLVVAANGSAATVPNLLTEPPQTKDQADLLIQRSGLVPNATADNSRECGQIGEVKSQNPAPGTKVQKGNAVSYTYCAEPDKIAIPLLVGKSLAQAQQQVESLKLDEALQITYEVKDSAKPKDEVVELQDGNGNVVEAGQSVEPGSALVVYYSNYKLRYVPNVVGQTEAVARALLDQKGFTNVVVHPAAAGDDPAQWGKVISQDPPSPDDLTEWDPTKEVSIQVRGTGSTEDPGEGGGD